MADRYMRQFPKVADTGMVILDGYVSLTTSSAVSTQTVALATVARTGTGEYTVTLADSYPSLMFFDVMPVLASNAQFTYKITSVDTKTTKKIVFQFITGTTATELGTGNGFYLLILLKNSSLAKGQ